MKHRTREKLRSIRAALAWPWVSLYELIGLADVLVVFGIGSLCYGVAWQWGDPFGFMVGGGIVLALGIALALTERPQGGNRA